MPPSSTPPAAPLALAFLDPGHFHAALTLGSRNDAVRDEVLVYAPDGPELAEFLALVEAFNRRSDRPTSWRPRVRHSRDPLADLVAEGRSDAVVVAGRTAGKMSLVRRLHDAGLPVLADKPWLTGPEALDDLRRALDGAPIAMELMTGRHEMSARVLERLVGEPDVFGTFAPSEREPAIVLDSLHHLAKVVNGAPLRRPPWYFDVRVQGDGLADTPTHLVDRAQRLVSAAGAGRPDDVQLVSARTWATPVPREIWQRVTGLTDFSRELSDVVRDGALQCRCNGELRARVGGVAVALTARWELVEPAGGGDGHVAAVRGTRAEVRIEQGARTGFRRRIVVEPGGDATKMAAALTDAVARWDHDLPGLAVAPADDGLEIVLPLASGHESHFALVLREFLGHAARRSAPAELAVRTRAKYELLAHAIAAARS